MLSVSNAVHAWSFFLVLTVFAVAGNPNKPIVGPTTGPGICHEQWCHGPVSILIVPTWTLGSAEGSGRQDRVDHCLRLKCRSSFRKWYRIYRSVACLMLFCSGGLAYTRQWQIGYIPQSTSFYNIYNNYCQICGCYFSRSCLRLHYQWWTAQYCISSLAAWKEVLPTHWYWYFSSVYRHRVSFVLLSQWRII
jgi:hypothetical protein